MAEPGISQQCPVTGQKEQTEIQDRKLKPKTTLLYCTDGQTLEQGTQSICGVY